MNGGFLKTVDSLTDLALVQPDPNFPNVYVAEMGTHYKWEPTSAVAPGQYAVDSLINLVGQWVLKGGNALENDVKLHGAVGDGVADDTAAIQALLDSTPSNATIFFPAGTYKITRLIFRDKIGVSMGGDQNATLRVVGIGTGIDYAGIVLQGTLTDCAIRDLKFQGDGTEASVQGAVTSNLGINIDNLAIERLTIRNMTVGIIISGSALDHVNGVKILYNYIENVFGTASGRGYGIATSLGGNRSIQTQVEGNIIIRAQRHSIYWSVGDGGSITNNFVIRHRDGLVSPGFTLGAINIARSGKVTCRGNHIIEANDTGLQVISDTGFISCGVSIIGNYFHNKQGEYADIFLGQSSPDIVGFPSCISVLGNMFESTGVAASPIWILCGKRISIIGNVMQSLLSPNHCSFINLIPKGEGSGTANYTDNIIVALNSGIITNTAGTAYGILVDAAGSDTSIHMSFSGNHIDNVTQFIRFLGTQTNPNVTFVDNIYNGALSGLLAQSLSGYPKVEWLEVVQSVTSRLGLISNAGSAAGGSSHVVMQNNSLQRRWALGMLGAESGSQSGAEVTLAAYNDDLTFRANYLRMNRSNGKLALLGGAAAGLSDPATAAASAILEASSTTKGFLPPRMTKAQRNAISAPADGLTIYQTDNTPGMRQRVGGAWAVVTTTADP